LQIFDGTYFHKDGCLAVIIDAVSKVLLAYWYIEKESYHNVLPMLINLKKHGLDPLSITIDGHTMVTRAIKEVWPAVLIQRCVYHIKSQGMQWLRRYPKSEAGKSLKELLNNITTIDTAKDRDMFTASYTEWLEKNRATIRSLPTTNSVNKDLK